MGQVNGMGCDVRWRLAFMLTVGVFVALCLFSGGVRAEATLDKSNKPLPRSEALHKLLGMRVSLTYEKPTHLTEIVAFLNQVIRKEADLAAALRVDPRIVEIDPRNVQIVMKDAPLGKVLNLLVVDATTREEEHALCELVYFIYEDAEVIYITNRPRMVRLKHADKELRTYGVRDLVKGSLGEGLLELLVAATGRENWGLVRIIDGKAEKTSDPGNETTNLLAEGDGKGRDALGSMLLYRDSALVVRTTPELHEQIDALQRDLRKAIAHTTAEPAHDAATTTRGTLEEF